MNETLIKETRKRSDPEIGDNKSDLRPFFAPQSVVIVGASPKKGNLGKYIVQSLLNQQYAGSVITVHPSGYAVADCPVVKDIHSLPETVDLAIVAVSSSKVYPSLNRWRPKGSTI